MRARQNPPGAPRPPRGRKWPRAVAAVAGIAGALIVVLVVGLNLTLRSAWFRRWALREIDTRASAAVGAPVTVGGLAVHVSLSSPSLELSDVKVAGAGVGRGGGGAAGPAGTSTTLASIGQVTLGVGIVSLLHREWHLEYLDIDRPVIRIVQTPAGSNVPFLGGSAGTPARSAGTPPPGSGLPAALFHELSIQHVRLDRGVIFYDDQPRRLTVDLSDLQVAAVFSPRAREYHGSLSYRNGRIAYGGFTPPPHALTVDFTLAADAVRLAPAILSVGDSRLTLDAEVTGFRRPRVAATYDLVLDATQLRAGLRMGALPRGVIRSDGALHYAAAPGRSALAALQVTGSASSALLLPPSPAPPLRQVAADYEFAGGDLSVTHLRAGVAGGEIAGGLTVRDLAGAAAGRASVRATALSLAALARAAAPHPPAGIAVAGRLDADVQLAWRGALRDLEARFDLDAAGTLRTPKSPAAMPVSAVVRGAYSAPAATLTLVNARFQDAHALLTANGTASRTASMQVALEVNDLGEVDDWMALFGVAPAGGLGLGGAATFHGSVAGALRGRSGPALAGEFRARPLTVRGTDWQLVETHIEVSPYQLNLTGGRMQAQGRGEIQFSLSAGLNDWRPGLRNPFDVNARAADLDAGALARLAGHGGLVSGGLALEVVLHGTPADPEGYGWLRLVRPATADGRTAVAPSIGGQPIVSLAVNFNGNASLLAGNGTLQLTAGAIHASGTYRPAARGYAVSLTATNLDLARLPPVAQRGLPVSGLVNVNATGAGALANPQLTAIVSAPQLRIAGQPVRGMQLTLNVANHVATAQLGTEAADAFVRGRATVHLAGDYQASGSLETTTIPLKTLVALYAPALAAAVGGSTQIEASGSGPLRQPRRWIAQATLPRLQFTYQASAVAGAPTPEANPAGVLGRPAAAGGAAAGAPPAVALSAANAIHLAYADGVLRVQPVSIAGTDVQLTLSGAVPLPLRAAAPPTLAARGSVNLGIVERFDPDLQSSGELNFAVGAGTAATAVSPAALTGRIDIVNAALASPGLPIGVTDANGTIAVDGGRLTLSKFQALLGGGPLTLSGAVEYAPALRFDLAAEAQRVSVSDPPGVTEAMSANLTFTGTARAAAIAGTVGVSDLAFTRNFDITRLPPGVSGTGPIETATGFGGHVRLNVAVGSTQTLTAASRTLDVQATAALRVEGTLASPVVLGRVDLDRGDLIFMGNRYQLQAGTVDFVDPVQTQPTVNLTAETTVQNYDIHLHLEGTPDSMRTNFTSDPSLPPADIINLLAFGQTTEQAAANAVPGNLGAESLIAAGFSSQLTSRVASIAGISQLSVDPNLGNNAGQQGTTITVQQRVTGNLFVTFSADVTGVRQEVVDVQYEVSPTVSFEAVRDQNGGFAFMTRFKHSW